MRLKLCLAALALECAGLLSAASPVATTEFAGGEQGRIVVQAKVNGKGPYPFLFDIGSVNILSLELANQLGIPVRGNQTANAFGGSVVTASAVLDSLTVNDLTLTRSQILVIGGGPFTHGEPVGILGWELLQKLVVEVDYLRGRLSFLRPQNVQLFRSRCAPSRSN